MNNLADGQHRRDVRGFLRRNFFPFAVLVFLLCGNAARADVVITNCSLQSVRDAIQNGQRVTFTNDCTFSLSAPLIVNLNAIIDASGHTIGFNGNNAVQVFRVVSNANFTLIHATVQNGNNTNGGGMFVESGSSVVLSNCIFISNKATGADGVSGTDGNDHSDVGGNGGNGTSGKGAFGGALYNNGTVSAYLCRFATNNAQSGNGGDGGNGGNGDFQGGNGGNAGTGSNGFGGAIYSPSPGKLVLSDCAFEQNAALGGVGGDGGAGGSGAFFGLAGNGKAGGEGSGGAIYSTGELSILGCTFSSNRTQSGNSAVAGNDSNGNGNNGPRGPDSFGGAIFTSGNAALTNSTLFANTVRAGNGGDGGPGNYTGGDGGNGGHGSGGSIYNLGTIYVLHCTLANGGANGGTNGAAGAAAFPGSAGNKGANRGGNVANAGNFSLKNSIVATNSSGGNGYGTFNDLTNNISSDNSIALGGGSFKNTDPIIGTLTTNGGPTKTIALFQGSPAIDAIADSSCLPVDQRGVARTNNCDIGAFEWLPTARLQGRITLGTNGASGIQLNVNGTILTSDTNGNFLIKNIQDGTYVITPQPVGLFDPTNRTVTIPPSATNLNFTAFEARATSIAFDSNRVLQINFLALLSHTEIIQASTNLINWVNIFTNTASSTNGLIQFADTNTSRFPKRFYRTIR